VRDQNFHIQSIKTLKTGLGNFALEEIYFSIFRVLRFMVSSLLLLALNGVTVVVFGYFLEGVTFSPFLLFAAFLVTFAVYGLNKYTDRAEDSINRPEILPKASSFYLVFSIVSMIVGFSIGLLEGILAFGVLCAPVIIGVIYSVKISPSIPRLKEIVGIKSLVVALSWALTGSLLPDSFHSAKLQIIAIVFVYIFIRVFVGTILCDVLDKKGDLASGVETIPIKLGRNKTKKLLILLNSLGMLLAIYCMATGILIRLMPALIFGVLYGYLAIWFFFKNKCKRFTAGLMLDGEWIPIVIIICLLIK
jgi:4-hydroxybenzoate polyprenyltransferase